MSFVTEVDDAQDASEVAAAVQQFLWDVDAGPESLPAWESIGDDD